MATEAWRHAALGDFLRTRRLALTPEDVGVPRGPRRRVPGLRREEVAAAAFVSTTWYTRLEQGQPVAPSPEVLDGLADALHLDTVARSYLHALATSPASSQALTPSPAVRADIEATVSAMNEPDRPVYAADGHGDLLAWNAAAADWYDDFAPYGDNITRWTFRSPDARAVHIDWEHDARDLVARMRFFLAASGADRRTHHLIDELRGVEQFERWWRLHEISDQAASRRRLRHPRTSAEQEFRLVLLRSALCPAVSLVVHLPTTPPTGIGRQAGDDRGRPRHV